jgi:AraC-like DNA-binding protein
VLLINPASMTEAASIVLNGRATNYECPDYAGALSLKAVLTGQAHYEASGTHFLVEPGNYLLLNQGQPYRMRIESELPVETFCLFFRPGLAEDVHRSLVLPAERLLDEPFPPPGSPSLCFFDRVYPADPALTLALSRLRAVLSASGGSVGAREEQLHGILEQILKAQQGALRTAETLPAARRATRMELYRRLHHARDYMDACLDQPLTLEQVATVACLSRHHFLRLFAHVFGETPHRYLTRQRLARAQALLRHSDESVTSIALLVGMGSPEAFSRLFRKHIGVSPGAFRRAARCCSGRAASTAK